MMTTCHRILLLCCLITVVSCDLLNFLGGKVNDNQDYTPKTANVDPADPSSAHVILDIDMNPYKELENDVTPDIYIRVSSYKHLHICGGPLLDYMRGGLSCPFERDMFLKGDNTLSVTLHSKSTGEVIQTTLFHFLYDGEDINPYHGDPATQLSIPYTSSDHMSEYCNQNDMCPHYNPDKELRGVVAYTVASLVALKYMSQIEKALSPFINAVGVVSGRIFTILSAFLKSYKALTSLVQKKLQSLSSSSSSSSSLYPPPSLYPPVVPQNFKTSPSTPSTSTLRKRDAKSVSRTQDSPLSISSASLALGILLGGLNVVFFEGRLPQKIMGVSRPTFDIQDKSVTQTNRLNAASSSITDKLKYLVPLDDGKNGHILVKIKGLRPWWRSVVMSIVTAIRIIVERKNGGNGPGMQGGRFNPHAGIEAIYRNM